MEERLSGELAKEHRPSIVIVNYPSETVRTIGVMTGVFAGSDNGPDLGTVFIPNGPRARTGYIRAVPVTDLEFTDWTLREFQLYQLTLGMVSPEEFCRNPNSDGAK